MNPRLPMPIIVGAPRSGTTLLRLMLDAHPDLALPAETGFLIPAFDAIANGVNLNAEEFISVVTEFHTWPDLDTDAESFAAAVRALDPFTVTSGTNEFFRMYAAARGKTRWGDKTPVYGQVLQPLVGVLPDAHIIHLIRDGRDVALSLRPTWFAPAQDVPTLAEFWVNQIRTTRAADVEHYLEVRYEDLLNDPEATLRRICDFIKLPFDPAMLTYHVTAAARLSEIQDFVTPDGSVHIPRERRAHNHRLTSEPPDPSRAGRWRTEMTAQEQDEFQAAAGDLLGELGYPLRTHSVVGQHETPTTLRVLITNCWLQIPGGSEQYVRDLSTALLRRGHQPVVYSPLLGQVAEEIRTLGVEVADDLSRISEPDILHCHNHYETIAALSAFPDRPGLFVQHAAVHWQDETPLHPRLLRYVAVDELCRQRTLAAGVPEASISLIANGIDLDRFKPRDPLPTRPQRAVVFSNHANASNYVLAIQEACDRMGIELDILGAGAGTSVADPETVLPTYDLVFAKARAAIESMAVGCAVVVTDAVGLAGMATSDVLHEWRTWNFGRALQTRANDVDALCAEIDRYSAEDAAICRDIARSEWSLDTMTGLLLAEYQLVLNAWDPATVDHRAELAALAGPLSRLGPLRSELGVASWYVEQYPKVVADLEQLRNG